MGSSVVRPQETAKGRQEGHMAKDIYGYPCEPRSLDKNNGEAWFYELRGGIEVVQELHRNGELLGTAMVNIPWAKVCAAVDRHRKIKAIEKRTR